MLELEARGDDWYLTSEWCTRVCFVPERPLVVGLAARGPVQTPVTDGWVSFVGAIAAAMDANPPRGYQWPPLNWKQQRTADGDCRRRPLSPHVAERGGFRAGPQRGGASLRRQSAPAQTSRHRAKGRSGPCHLSRCSHLSTARWPDPSPCFLAKCGSPLVRFFRPPTRATLLLASYSVVHETLEGDPALRLSA